MRVRSVPPLVPERVYGADQQLYQDEEALRSGCAQRVKFMRVPLQGAVLMASETPAEILSVPRKGRMRPGVDADLVLLSTECTVEETIVSGETIY